MISSVLAFLAGVATKVVQVETKPADPLEVARLKAQFDQLGAQLGEALSELKVVTQERDRWRTLAHEWRRTAQRNAQPIHQVTPEMQQYLQAAAEFQRLQLAAQTLQGSPLQQADQAMLGAQSLFQAFDEICNCVPARYDLFRRI